MIKVDTGMSRNGCQQEELDSIMDGSKIYFLVRDERVCESLAVSVQEPDRLSYKRFAYRQILYITVHYFVFYVSRKSINID